MRRLFTKGLIAGQAGALSQNPRWTYCIGGSFGLAEMSSQHLETVTQRMSGFDFLEASAEQ
jgi:hypothetical protein